jgi:hypothetical protein
MYKRLAGCLALALALGLPALPAHAAPSRYEAENALISQGVVEANHLNFSGTGFVNADNVVGSYVEWTFNAPTAGTATLTIRYANGTTTARPADIAVNATVIEAASSFGATANWDTWADKTITAPVNVGANTLRVTGTTANGPANVDYLDVEVAAPPVPVAVYQAENATLSQAGVFSNHNGFTGTGFVDYVNVSSSYVEWTVTVDEAGPQTLTLRYANGTAINRPMTIAVNGTVLSAEVPFGATSNWDTWADRVLTATLNAGANTIRATATTANGGPNVDKLSVTGGTAPPDPGNPYGDPNLVSMFNGTSLDGWTPSRPDGWTVQNGAIHGTGAGRGWIYHNNQVGTFRWIFSVRQVTGDHAPTVLIWGTTNPVRDALSAIQFQPPNGGHWDYRPGHNNGGGSLFTSYPHTKWDIHNWSQCELIGNHLTGVARMACCPLNGAAITCVATEVLKFTDITAGGVGPLAIQIHNSGIQDEFRNLYVESPVVMNPGGFITTS